MRTSSPPIAAILLAAATARAGPREQGLDALRFIDTHLKMPSGKYAALYADYYTPGQPAPLGNGSAWAAGVMLSALNAAARLDPARTPAAASYAKALDLYRYTMPAGVPGYQPFPGNRADEMFYDDNAWLALAFLETYDLTHDVADLQRSRDAFDFVASGESPELGGGIYWSTKRGEKNACVNAPAIVAALRLYETTKEPRYLELAERLYAWMPRLQDTDGLYFDHVTLDGTIGKTKWSYNAALMIRANVLFARIKHDPKYLAEANRIADAAAVKWFRASDGALTDDAAFGHLLCEALLELDETSPRPATVARIRRALDQVATLARDGGYPKRFEGWRDGEKKIELLAQASAARAFLIAALHAQRIEAPR